MPKLETDSIRIEDVATDLGYAVRNGQCACPNAAAAHAGGVDRHPSCTLGGRNPALFHCKTCGATGDAVHFVSYATGCDQTAAISYLRQSGFLPNRARSNGSSAPPANPITTLAARRRWAESALLALGAKPDGREVHFPMRDATGAVVGWRRRMGDGSTLKDGKKALSVFGSTNCPIYPHPLPDGVVLLVEGEADAAAALSAGWAAVVATPGADLSVKTQEELQRILAGRNVVLAPDPGPAGEKWTDLIGKLLRSARATVSVIPPLPGMDLDNRLSRAGAEAGKSLAQMIDAAAPAPAASTEIGVDGLSLCTDRGAPIPLNVARAIRKGRRLIHVAGAFREYERGVYVEQPDFILERDVIKLIDEKAKKNSVADVIAILRMLSAVETSKIVTTGRVINLRNGLLDLDQGLLPHSPDHIMINQLPIDFDPAATCPTWEKALVDWFGEDRETIELIQDYIGYCLIPDCRQHKALVLLGESGGEGKSVLCAVINQLIGAANVSAVPLSALGRSFALADLYGKLVNLTLEAEIRDGIEEGAFKALVAGDPIQAERKFKDPFTFSPFVRFIIATNNLWHVNDRSGGFYRRLLVIRFNRPISEDKQDRQLPDKLTSELNGIFNWALRGLARLERRGRFYIPDSVKAEVEAYRQHCNPVIAWAADCCELNPLRWTSAFTLYNSFKAWAAENGHRAMAANKFGTELKRLNGVSFRQDGIDRARGYDGIMLR